MKCPEHIMLPWELTILICLTLPFLSHYSQSKCNISSPAELHNCLHIICNIYWNICCFVWYNVINMFACSEVPYCSHCCISNKVSWVWQNWDFIIQIWCHIVLYLYIVIGENVHCSAVFQKILWLWCETDRFLGARELCYWANKIRPWANTRSGKKKLCPRLWVTAF